jgi:hypothetical protein
MKSLTKYKTAVSYGLAAGLGALMVLLFVVNILEFIFGKPPSGRFLALVYIAACAVGYIGWQYGFTISETPESHAKD